MKKKFKRLDLLSIHELVQLIPELEREKINLSTEFDYHLKQFDKINESYTELENIRTKRNSIYNNKANFKKSLFFKPRHLNKESRELSKSISSEIEILEEKLSDAIEIALFEEVSTYSKYTESDLDRMFEILKASVEDMSKRKNLIEKKLINANKLVERKRRTKSRKEAKKEKLARLENKQRYLNFEVHKNLKENEYCPYCNSKINDAEIDHIYPVGKGGLSTYSNLIYVCSECNRKKSDFTLFQFIEKYGLNRNKIEENLKNLNKDF